MLSPLPFIDSDCSLQEVSKHFTKENDAVLVRDLAGNDHILTKLDLIAAISA